MRVSRHPVIPITITTALGVLAGNGLKLPVTIAFIAAFLALAALVLAWLQSRTALIQRPHFAIAALVTAFSIGLLASSIQYAPAQKFHYSHFITKGTPVIKGIIRERLKPDEYRDKYYFDVLSVNMQTASGTLLLTTPKDSLKRHSLPGDAFIIAGTPQPIARPLNPYSFDYAAYMEKQGIFHQLGLGKNYINAGVIKNPDYYIGRFRESLIKSFDIHEYSPEIQSTLNALVFGQRQDLDKAITDAYKDAGVMHILAISGLHFTVLFYMLTVMFRPLNRLGKRGKLLQFITILAILWGFALLTGLSASVVRSVVMFTFILTGKHFNRNANIYNSLAISFLLLILCNPDFLFDAGFQLSYLAVLGIVTAEPLYRKVHFSKYRAVNYIPDLLMVSLAAQIAVLPLSLYYFGQIPLLFLLANIVVIPVSNAVLILGLVTLLLNFIWTDAALWAGKLLELLITRMNAFIEWVAAMYSFVIRDIPFTAMLAFVLYCVLILVVLWCYKKTFMTTAAVLSGILFFQGIATATLWHYKNDSEMIIFHNRKSPLMALKNGNHLAVSGTDSTAITIPAVYAYRKGTFNPETTFSPLRNFYYHEGKKIIVINKNNLVLPPVRADILILAQSPNINLERALQRLKPAQVIADGTNSRWDLKLWSATCKKQKIPFHATAEKGFYRIE